MEERSLNHVYMLTDKGMVHVTRDDVKQMHPVGNISAGSGRNILQCRLCGRPVEFFNGAKRYGLKHPKRFDNSCCPDYTGKRVSYASHIRNNIYQELPVRLSISGNAFRFELGVIIPQFDKLKSSKIKIQLSDGSSFEYNAARLKESTAKGKRIYLSQCR